MEWPGDEGARSTPEGEGLDPLVEPGEPNCLELLVRDTAAFPGWDTLPWLGWNALPWPGCDTLPWLCL